MSPAPIIDGLVDGDQSASYARRVLLSCLFKNHDTGEVELLPQKTWVFNPDLSIHSVDMVSSLGSSIEAEYESPPNWALRVPVQALLDLGAALKHTPHNMEATLGPAHHSIFGVSRTPSKTDKANMRDVLMANVEWIGSSPVLP